MFAIRSLLGSRPWACSVVLVVLILGACSDSDEPPEVVRVGVPTTAQDPASAGGPAAGADAVPPSTGGSNPPESTPQGPRIELVPAQLDFGTVVAGEEVECTVEVHNRGDAVLHLRGVRVGCGCVKARLDAKELAPGEMAEMVVCFRSVGQVGPTEKNLRVLSDDPRRKGADFRYEVDVVRLVELRPDGFDFDGVLVEDGAQRSIDLVSIDQQPFRVLGIECRDPLLEFEIQDFPGESPCRVRVLARLAAEAPLGWPGQQPLAVFLNLDHPRHDRFKVAVSGHVRSPVLVEPNMLDFGAFSSDEERLLSVEVRHLRASPTMPVPRVEVQCRANDLLPDPEQGGRKQFVVAEVVELEAGARYRVDLRILPGYPLRTLSGQLRIHLEAQERPRSIPLLGKVDGR